MEYTLENTLKAKKFLIENGFSENDFTEATTDDVEVGYIVGEPLILSDGDDCKSAFDLYKEKLFWDENEDAYIDYMLKNCL